MPGERQLEVYFSRCDTNVIVSLRLVKCRCGMVLEKFYRFIFSSLAAFGGWFREIFRRWNGCCSYQWVEAG